LSVGGDSIGGGNAFNRITMRGKLPLELFANREVSFYLTNTAIIMARMGY
jgi:hypothetical protein|tara:strand:+ start:552 stop:701 length:150 start_codon:yes stop_codon:yes gene_type:complete